MATKIATKRIEQNIFDGLTVDYNGGDYTAVATDGLEDGGYYLSLHRGAFPAFETKFFETVDTLAQAMKEIADLRTWKLVRHE